MCADPEKYGIGHFYRCINLYSVLNNYGLKTKFFIDNKKQKFKSINKHSAQLKISNEINKLSCCDWLVIDHYEWEKYKYIFNNQYPKILLFDDNK